jgi:hypothetical protein
MMILDIVLSKSQTPKQRLKFPFSLLVYRGVRNPRRNVEIVHPNVLTPLRGSLFL